MSSTATLMIRLLFLGLTVIMVSNVVFVHFTACFGLELSESSEHNDLEPEEAKEKLKTDWYVTDYSDGPNVNPLLTKDAYHPHFTFEAPGRSVLLPPPERAS